MRNDFLNIWVVGTYANQLEGIGSDLYKCRFVTTEDIEGQNINHLNRFVNEFVCQWYVWKNNIKSEYVAFCHYRRQQSITKMIFPDLKNGAIQYFYALYIPETAFDMNHELPFITRNKYMPKFMIDDLVEYLHTQKVIPIEDIKAFCTPEKDKDLTYICRETYACKWEVFCDMMEFVCGYFDFICQKYNLKTKKDWIDHISNNVIAHYKAIDKKIIENVFQEWSLDIIYQKREDYLRIFDEDEGLNSYCNNWRVYAYAIEDLIGLYIGTHKRVCYGELSSGHCGT